MVGGRDVQIDAGGTGSRRAAACAHASSAEPRPCPRASGSKPISTTRHNGVERSR